MYSQGYDTVSDMDSIPTGVRAAQWLRQVADMLVEKCHSYGDSIGNPVTVFGKYKASDGIKIRLNDKLSRMKVSGSWPGDDNLKDLVGYLALLAVVED